MSGNAKLLISFIVYIMCIIGIQAYRMNRLEKRVSKLEKMITSPNIQDSAKDTITGHLNTLRYEYNDL